ncbi:uncharacterized protein L3040_007122 [Drepanopeziza brunnea f. sp. 'multigermtubi']|uniref:uncharacterized protein n=1 Tax=Drepanopeziza brunnea f. sp. 'multigermtubi' TaxID=698441 RepID=UPI0023A294C6|nr:hypothetical protein L3040_007122 [Drepanopeziza brunnea f. sp. 'multigermtubi']
MAVSPLSDEDAQSLIELSMSRAATRLKSPLTPAVEKAAAMEEMDGGGFFDSDDVETPPAAVEQQSEADLSSPGSPKSKSSSSLPVPENVPEVITQAEAISPGRLPSPKMEEPASPTPWHPGRKSLTFDPKEHGRQSSMATVFGGNSSRTRSLSGGAEALKKLLPKGLPSIAQVGHLFGSSSNNSSKTRSSGSVKLAKESSFPRSARSPKSRSPERSLSPLSSEPIAAPQPQNIKETTPSGPKRPPILRRTTSDNSLLYHSLSRTSSLGDDTRFENHREQVNSRVKAIRDTLQDRSSFRLPQIPTIPTGFPSLPSIPSILPSAIVKKKSSVAAPAVNPGTGGAAVSRSEASLETSRPLIEGPSTTYLDRALENLTGDVVIMGGYRGSILRSARTNRQVWVPVKVGLNIRKVDLEVGLEPEDEERMTENIYPSGMIQNIGPIDISKRLFKRLSESENAKSGKLRVWDYGYDWRLSPHLLSRKLQKFLEGLPSNNSNTCGSMEGDRGALVIAHSLGGLITRHVVNQRPELFSGVIYAGVPQSCINILGPLRNGDAVLLSSRVLTAQVNFTLRTSFVLLPENGACFVDIKTKEKYPIDFFKLDNWIKYRLSPCIDPPLPPKNPPSGPFGGLLNLPSSLLSLPSPGRKPTSGPSSPTSPNLDGSDESRRSPSPPTKMTRAADAIRGMEHGTDRTLAPQMAGMGNHSSPVNKGHSTNSSVSTAVTIPRDKAIAYLDRTLRETKKFKQELYFNPAHSDVNAYPPLALIYGKSIPTCCGAKVDGIDSIPCADVYDNLAFASGDGVCLAREAMLPEGYKAVYGGRVRSDRGHVTLLGDLNAVGRAIEAVMKGRVKGIGRSISLGGITEGTVT